MDLSCAAVKEGRVLAYSLLSRQSQDAVIFEQIASAAAGEPGAILLPYMFSTDRFFESGYDRCAFAIYPSNTASNRIRQTLEKEMRLTEKVTRKYKKRTVSV